MPWQSPPRLSPACPHREHRTAAAAFLFPAGPRAQIPVGTVSRVPGGILSQLGCWACSSPGFRLGSSGPDSWWPDPACCQADAPEEACKGLLLRKQTLAGERAEVARAAGC